MRSTPAQRMRVAAVGALAVLGTAAMKAIGPADPSSEAGERPCAAFVEVAGAVARPGVACAGSVGEAVARAGGAVGCRVPPQQGAWRVETGARVTLGEGERGACAIRVGDMPGARRMALGLRIDLNRATAADLDALPRIGPSLARRIVADRERRGPFPDVAALRRVRGIGPKTLARLRPFVTARRP